MKKIKIISLIIIVLMLITISSEVIAVHTASHVATHAAAASMILTSSHRRNKSSKSIEELAEQIYNETQNEELKNYILENKQYLYLSSEDKAKETITKYKESNLEETKQFIKDNYYDENKPKNDEIWAIFAIGIIIIIFILGIVAIFTI